MENLSRRAVLLGGASLPLATTFITPALAQTRWQLATAYPDGNFHTRNLRDFITEVQGAASGLQIQMHSNASLLKMPEIKRGVQTGQAHPTIGTPTLVPVPRKIISPAGSRNGRETAMTEKTLG